MKYDIQELFICQCSDPQHQLIMTADDDWGSVFCSVHLKPAGFFKRLWIAMKYICGHRSIYGDFDEFIFDVDDADRLQIIVDHLKAFKKKREEDDNGKE